MTLLRAVMNCQNHELRSTFPPVVVRTQDLGPRPHDIKLLPGHRDDINFVNRVLFSYLNLAW